MVYGFNLGVGIFCFIQSAIYFYLANVEEDKIFNYIASFVIGLLAIANFWVAF